MTNNISRPPSPYPFIRTVDTVPQTSQIIHGQRLSPQQSLHNLQEWANQAAYGEDRLEALNRITHAHRQQLNILDIKGLSLTSFPPHLDILVPQLTVLDMSNNKLSNLLGMQRLEQLQELLLERNEIQSLQGIVASPLLRKLALEGNQISTLVSMPILHNLEILTLRDNQLESLTGMPELGNLIELDVSINSLRDIHPLRTLVSLTQLFVENNQITNFSGLEGLNELKELWAQGNPIRSLQGLPATLSTLDLSSCQLDNLSGIENLPLLQSLYVVNNQLNHLNELNNSLNLETLHANNNFITEFNNAGLPNLNELQLDSEVRQTEGENTASLIADIISQTWSQGDFQLISHLADSGDEISQEDTILVNNFYSTFYNRLALNIRDHFTTPEGMSQFLSALTENEAFNNIILFHLSNVMTEINNNEILQVENIISLMINPESSSPAEWASLRWGNSGNVTVEYAEYFLQQTVSESMREKLTGNIPGGEILLRLCAGQAYTATVKSQNQLNQVVQRVRDNMAYLEQHIHNEELIREVIEVADDAVNRCGDRVSYGETRLHHVLETHRLTTQALHPSQIWQKLESSYNQILLEDFAARLSRERGESSDEESVELYLSLAVQIKNADHRVPLQELTKDSLFGHLYNASENDVQSALNLLRNKENNQSWKAWLLEHPATEKLLIKTFSAAHERMLMQREILSDAGSDLMFGQALSQSVEKINAAYRYAYGTAAPEVSQMNGLELLNKSGQLEQAWKEKCLGEIIRNTSLLN